MQIVWDEPKRQANIAKHGLDFADLTVSFFLDAQVIETRDRRFMAIGRFADGTIAVVFAALGSQGLSIISMRPAGKKEREFHEGI